MEAILYRLYYTEHNYDGIDKLTKKAKLVDKSITTKQVADWLRRQNTYQLNFVKPTRKVDFLPIYSEGFSTWQIDLTFIPQYKKQNNDNYILFTAIHINSRFAYASYAKDKKSVTILHLMEEFDDKYHPTQIDGDKGSEFINKFFINYLKEHQIGYNFYKSDSHKLGIINRFHRTLKDKIQKYITSAGSTRWIDVLESIIDSYNNTFHRGIQSTPKEVFESELLQSLIVDEKKAVTDVLRNKVKDPFQVGDKVRVRITLKQFQNKMVSKNQDMIYSVVKVSANTVGVIDTAGRHYKFKKSEIFKILDENIENRVEDVAEVARKVNRDIRVMRKEDLIDEPTATRTRLGGVRPQATGFVD